MNHTNELTRRTQTMYKQEIDDIIREWFLIGKRLGCKWTEIPISLEAYIKLRSQNSEVKFIKDEDWEIIKNQRTKVTKVDAMLASIEEDF